MCNISRSPPLIAQAAKNSDWVLGSQEETWWTRLAHPELFAWAASDPLRLGTKAIGPEGGGPEALACYGVLRQDTGAMAGEWSSTDCGKPASAVVAARAILAWLRLSPAAAVAAVLNATINAAPDWG